MDRERLDETTTDVWCRTNIQKYGDRPDNQAALTHAEHFTSFNNDQRRAQLAVLRYHTYPLCDMLNYKREHVLLVHPCRREADILENNAFVDICDNGVSQMLAVKAP
ncbi:hypothetical protein MRX96_035738 [Rhipicephalus microplus]